VHSEQFTGSRLAHKIDHFAWLAANRKTNRPTTNRAIFDQRLLRLRRVDL